MPEKLLRVMALGAAAAATAMLFVPAVAEAARPVARRSLKLAILAFLQGREAVASAVEMAEDAYAEACSELKQQAEDMAGETATAGPPTPGAVKHEAALEPKSRHQ